MQSTICFFVTQQGWICCSALTSQLISVWLNSPEDARWLVETQSSKTIPGSWQIRRCNMFLGESFYRRILMFFNLRHIFQLMEVWKFAKYKFCLKMASVWSSAAPTLQTHLWSGFIEIQIVFSFVNIGKLRETVPHSENDWLCLEGSVFISLFLCVFHDFHIKTWMERKKEKKNPEILQTSFSFKWKRRHIYEKRLCKIRLTFSDLVT